MSKKKETKLVEKDFNKELSIINDKINEVEARFKAEIAECENLTRLELTKTYFPFNDIPDLRDRLRYLNKKVNIIASFLAITVIALIAFVVR